MSDTVYFKCPHCGQAYVAKSASRSDRHYGILECVGCDNLAHVWTGFYALFDWQPARTERGEDAERYPQQPLVLGDKWNF